MTAACVIDASAIVSSLVPNQSCPAADDFFARAEDPWLALRLMSLEVRDALVRLGRRGLLIEGSADGDLGLLESRIVFVPAPSSAALVRMTGLARQVALGVYDAVYLDLAARTGSAIASRDAALIAASTAHGVPVRDLR